MSVVPYGVKVPREGGVGVKGEGEDPTVECDMSRAGTLIRSFQYGGIYRKVRRFFYDRTFFYVTFIVY